VAEPQGMHSQAEPGNELGNGISSHLFPKETIFQMLESTVVFRAFLGSAKLHFFLSPERHSRQASENVIVSIIRRGEPCVRPRTKIDYQQLFEGEQKGSPLRAPTLE